MDRVDQADGSAPSRTSAPDRFRGKRYAFWRRFGIYLSIALMLLISLLFIIPFVWAVVSAFRENPQLTVEFTDFWLGNFVKVFTGDTAIWIRNSLIIASGATLMATVFAFLAAYPFARLQFRGKTVILFALLVSMTIPLGTVMVPTFSLARSLRLENTLIGVILIIAARSIPLSIWVLKEFVAAVPIDLEEAAWVDGASLFDTLSRIVFPLTAPGIAVMGMLTFLAGWGDFVVSLLLISSPKLLPISMGIYKTSLEATSYGQVVVDYGVQTAISLIYMIPPVLLYLLFRRYLIRGVTMGALKG